MRVICAIEDPGAANGMVGLADALTAKGASLEIYATGAATAYAASIGLAVRELDKLNLPVTADALLAGTSENPDSPVFSLTRAAKEAYIPTFGYVDGPANAAYRFRGLSTDPLAHAPDFLLVSDAAARDAFISLGITPGTIDVVGHAGMDRVRTRTAELDGEGRMAVRARLFAEIDAARPLVVFLAETSDGLDPAEFRRNYAYTLSGRGDSDGRTEICLEETLDALTSVAPEAAMVLRLHPKNDSAMFTPYTGGIAAISSGGDPLEVIYAADLVIGMTSVLLFEAAVMGRPGIAVTPRQSEAAWLSSIALGLTSHVCTTEALRDSIKEKLQSGQAAMKNLDDLVPPGAAMRMADAICRRIEC